MYEPHTVQPLTRAEFAFRLLKHGLIVSSLIGVSLLVGMAGYRYIAGLPWIDAFLNAAMLLGGMGPVDDMPTDAAKLFAGFLHDDAGRTRKLPVRHRLHANRNGGPV